ncbi:MAG: alpha/beta hydrolase domain-containing protein, partial [Myxococcales bacterium]|nr:alpha/beta hydrolase domain-containing protein [Myxococcales bacterium]
AGPVDGMTAQPIAGTGSIDNPVMADPDAQPDPDTDVEPEPEPDCTPLEWDNPGNVPVPDITPVAADSGKGEPFGHALGLEEAGYEEHEFFFSSQSPAFTSRFVVVRPSDPAKFSGTVFVEWYNVSGSMDVPVMWSASQEYFKRSGHVYVGVSAQAAGVSSLLTVDPERYANVSHPGDASANTIFSRAGAAIRAQPDLVLGVCMPPHAVLGLGQSQSSGRLVDYLNSAAAADQVYDAIMTHSGGTPPANPPVPTFVIRTMNEGNASSNGPNVVEWDVAGASHNDKRLTENSFDIIGEAYGFDEIPFTCANPMNDYPAYRAYNAALDWMSRWVRDGERPPEGAPFEMAGAGFALDEVGNMKGGVRLPDIDVPIKVYSAENGPAAGADIFSAFVGVLACGLAGTANPLSPQQLLELYPTHEDYVRQYTEAADRALAAGFLLQADYDEMIAIAEAAPIPN